MSEKQINIKANLDDSQLRKQLSELEKEKHKINVDADSSSVNNTAQNIKQLSKIANESSSIFGKLKSAISNTFSTGKLAMTSYLIVLREINQASKNFKQSMLEIDKAITDLSVATNMSRKAVSGLVKDYNFYGKQLASTTTQITSAADDYLRAGKDMNEAQALIKDSIMLSKLGKLDSGSSTENLLAVMNGYEMSIHEVGKALDAMVAIDMEAATSAGDVATALKYSASSADLAGVSFNKLAAMTATVQDKTQQSAETIGTFMNTVLSRYRNVKIGQFIDDDGESLSEVETILDSLGIKLRDTNQEFRNFETVIDEVAHGWDSYSSVQQSAIAKAFAGTRQQNRFIALMQGYNKTLELTEVAANSAGTALDKFNNSYMNSLEAKENTLQASFESMVMNSDFDSIYSGILDATTALVDFINETNALKGIFTGLALTGGVKAFLSLKTGINEAYISLNQFQNALNIAKQTSISTNDFDKLLLLSNNLTQSQMKLLLSSKNLSSAQREQMLVNSGLSIEEAKLQLETWGLTTANNGLTVATTTLKNAALGLWNTLLANPFTVIIATISAATMAYNSYKQKVEETRQANIKASDGAIDTANELKKLYIEYSRLNSIQDKTSSEEDEYRGVIENITVALGERADALKGLSQGTEEYTKKLQELTKEELKNQYTSAVVGRKSAEDTLKDTIWSDIGGSTVSVDSNSQGKKLSNDATKAVEIVSDALKEYEAMNRTWGNISWDINSDNPDDAVEYYNALLKARENLVASSKDNEALLDTQIYNDINNAINAMSDDLDTYISKRYEELKLDYLVQNTIPTTAEEYQKMENAIADATGANEGLQSAFKDLLAEDFSGLYAKIQEELESENIEPDIEIFSISSIIDQLNTQLKPTFDSLQSAYQKIFTIEDGKEIFTLENVDISMFKDIQSSIEELNKAGLNIDLSSYDEFARTLSDSSSTADEVREVINNLATSVLDGTNAMDGMDESTAQLVATMLESLGVANANEIVTHELAVSKEEARLATLDLANASVDSMKGLLNEAGAAGLTRGEIYKLAAAEIAFGDNDLNFSGKIAKLQELAGAYGDTATQVMLASAADRVAAGHGTYESVMADMLAQFNKAAGSVKMDFSNVGGGSKSAGKAGKEAADEYLEAFEKELAELDRLKDLGILSEKSYLDSLRRLYNKYYAKKEKYLKEYQEQEKKYLNGMKSLYESAFSYITKQIDKRIDSVQKEQDAQIASMEAQKKAAEDFYQNQIDEIEEQIEAIDKEVEAKQDLIDAINDSADARKRELDLQKAQYDLERMQNQNTQLVYKDGQMSYEADTTGIRDAREEVEDAKREIEIASIEKVIDGLEKQKDLLEDQQEALEKALDASNAYWDGEIEKSEKHFDSIISGLEETKSKFQELSEVFENAQMESTLQELGINMEALLSGSTEEFDKLKTSYIGILADISRNNDGVLEQMSKFSGVSAETVSYLESTKSAFENLGTATLDPLSTSVEETATATEGLSTSATEASTAVGEIGTNASNTTASITPLNDELQKLKDLLSELTTLFDSLEFPTPGDEGYAQKLEAIATAFGNIASKCKEFEQINFSSIIGAEGENGQGTGFSGLGSVISDAVTTINLQMTALETALKTGNDAFDTQIKKIQDEYIPAWEKLQTRLAEIIGVGSGGSSEDGTGTKTKTTTETDTEGGNGSIVDIMQTGGDEVAAKLEDPWLKSFNEFATGENSIQSIANLIKDIVTEMATTIQAQCAAAAEAIRKLANEALNSSSILSIDTGGHGGGGGSRSPNTRDYQGTVGSAFASGTSEYVNLNNIPNSPITGYKGLSKDEKNALRSEYGQPELTVYPNGTTELTTEPVMSDLPKGTVIFNEEQTKRIMSNEGEILGNAYANGVINSKYVPVAWNRDQIDIQKRFLQLTDMGVDMFNVPSKAMFAATESMNDVVKSMKVNDNSVVQHNTYHVTLPNVTNESKALDMLNELQRLPMDAKQYTLRK